MLKWLTIPPQTVAFSIINFTHSETGNLKKKEFEFHQIYKTQDSSVYIITFKEGVAFDCDLSDNAFTKSNYGKAINGALA